VTGCAPAGRAVVLLVILFSWSRCVLVVKAGPQADPVGGWIGDLLDEPADEAGLRGQQGGPVLLLDQEERGHPAGHRRADQRPDLGQLPVEVAEPPPEQAGDLIRRQRGDQRERRHKRRVLVLRLLDQLAQPVAQLGPARVGQRVHGAFRPLAGPAGLLFGDEAGPGQLADDHIQRPVVVLDAAVVTVLAQVPAELVRVHGLLAQVRQHREGEQVADLALAGHRWRPGQALRAGSSRVGTPPSALARRASARYSREHIADSRAIPPLCTRTSPPRTCPVSRIRRPFSARPGWKARLTWPRPVQASSQWSMIASSATSSLTAARSRFRFSSMSPSGIRGDRRSITTVPCLALTSNTRAVVQWPSRFSVTWSAWIRTGMGWLAAGMFISSSSS